MKPARLKLSAAALAIVALGLGTGGAASPPVGGKITCVIEGSANLKPPLTNAGAGKKAVTVKGDAGTKSCDASQVTGGNPKLGPIAEADIKVQGKSDRGAGCASLMTPKLNKTKLQIKWRNSEGKTVAKDITTIQSIMFNLVPFGFTVTSAPLVKGGFQGKTITAVVVLNQDAAELAAECASTGITELDFHASTNPSSISASPSGTFLDGGL
jgi:hypothetical protein